MFKTILLLIFSFLIIGQIAAQKVTGAITGTVVDSSTLQKIDGATVSVLSLKDSSLIAFTLSNKNGKFAINNIAEGNYIAIISHLGLESHYEAFTIDAKKDETVLGNINLVKRYTELGEVVVQNIIPIVVNGDTVQFNASAFKTKLNATVEDLIKKLPGLQVDKEGNIIAHGKDVHKVLVDGKEFFGTDPKLATRNLTADMIESVQVFEDMSEQAKFTKIDDGNRSTTINLKLKKDKKKGSFGRALVAAGTEDRYEGNFSLNKFNDDQQFSLLANANNVNKGGMSQASPGNYSGSGMQVGAVPGGSGVNRSISSGLNFRNDIGNKLRLNGSYFFNNNNLQDQQQTYRKSFFPGDSVTLYSGITSLKSMNQNHRFNFRVEFMLDSMNSILYIPALNIQRTENFDNDSSYVITSKPGYEYLSLTNRNINTQILDGNYFTQNFLYRKKFKKPGRTFTLGWNNAFSKSKDLGYSKSPYNLYNPDGSLDRFSDQDQQSRRNIKSNNNVLSASLTEAIGNNKLLELNYAYTFNQNTSDRQTMDYNLNSKKYDISNLALTNNFENDYTASRIGANFRIHRDKFNLQLGGGVQLSELSSNSYRAITGNDSLTKQRYTNIFPTASLRYSPEKNKNVGFNYRGRSKQPSIIQLQDVEDVSNPLQVYTGNPMLDQEFNHSVSLNYTSFNKSSFKYASYNLNVTATDNKIVNSIDSARRGVQTIQPVNMDGAFNISSLATFGFPFKNSKLAGSNINFTSSLSYNRSISMLYKKLNIGKTITASQHAGFNFNFNEKLDLGINAQIAYNRVSYSVNTFLNDDYLTQTYSTNLTWFLPLHFILQTEMDFYINSGRSEGFNQRYKTWNGYIAKQIFENNQAEIRFSVNDILDQNKNIERFNGENFIEDTRSNVLQRYFMLGFMYNLSRLSNTTSQHPTRF